MSTTVNIRLIPARNYRSHWHFTATSPTPLWRRCEIPASINSPRPCFLSHSLHFSHPCGKLELSGEVPGGSEGTLKTEVQEVRLRWREGAPPYWCLQQPAPGPLERVGRVALDADTHSSVSQKSCQPSAFSESFWNIVTNGLVGS